MTSATSTSATTTATTTASATEAAVPAGRAAPPAPSTGAPANGAGRPRDPSIDDAVLRATAELLAEVGYVRLSVSAIAKRAGTNKPAIYRRWPTKAHLVYEAVFPVEGRSEALPSGDDLRSDIRALVALGLDLLSRPAARAAVPGLMAEAAGDPALAADLVARFEADTWGWIQSRIDAAVASGRVRPGVRAADVVDLISGATTVAIAIRPPHELDADWVDRVVDIIVGGIAP